MEVDDETIEAFLAHYASQYYDPVKAHEYYMRKRKLKGRFSTKGFTKKQTEAWAYVKDQVRTQKQRQTAQAKTARDVGIEKARQRAAVLRAEVAKKLEALDASMPKEAARAEREKIAGELKAVIAKYRAKYVADKTAAGKKAEAALANEYKNVKKRVR